MHRCLLTLCFALLVLPAHTQQTVPLDINPYVLAVNPALNRVYISSRVGPGFDIYDAAANTVTSVTASGKTYIALACNPTTGHLFAADIANNAVVAMDQDGNITSTHPTGTHPQAVALDSNAGYVYILSSVDKTLTILNGNSLTTTTANVGAGAHALLVNPLTHRAYVANSTDNTVTVVNGANATTSTVTVGTTPLALALNPITNKIYVANTGSNTVTIIDGATNTTTTVPVDGGPNAIAVDPTTNKAFVANYNGQDISVLSGTSVIQTIPISGSAYAIAVDPNTATVHVVGQTGDTLFNIDEGTGNITTVTDPTILTQAIASNPITAALFVSLNSKGLFTASHSSATVFNPIVMTLAGVVDINTVTNPTLFETKSTTPSFQTTGLSTYASTTPYATSNTATNPLLSSFYFQLDSTSGSWTRAIPNQSSSGASFTYTLPVTAQGNHTLYVFAGYGNEGGQGLTSTAGSGNSPEISNIKSLPFLIDGIATTTSVGVNIFPQLSGVNFTITASVQPSAATGTIAFTDTFGTTVTPLGTVTMSGGGASLTTSLVPIGFHTITATYSGDNTYFPSSGTTQQVIYLPDTTSTLLTAAPSTINLGDSSTLTATVTDTTTPSIVTAGQVTFTDAFNGFTKTLTISASQNGVATFFYTPTDAGTHNLTATYTPIGNSFMTSTGTATLIVQAAVTPPPPTPAQSFTFTIIGNPEQRVDGSGNATFTFALAPSTGNIYPSDIHFSAASNFTAINPAFSPASVAQASGPQTITLTLRNAPHLSSNRYGTNLIFAALLLLPFLRLKRLRKTILPLAALLLLAANAVTGCGWGVRTYPVVVTATSTKQIIQVNTSVRLMD